MKENLKLTRDGFLWLLISQEQAKVFLKNNIMMIYYLSSDDSESLIEDVLDLDKSEIYGIEIGYINEILQLNNHIKVM